MSGASAPTAEAVRRGAAVTTPTATATSHPGQVELLAPESFDLAGLVADLRPLAPVSSRPERAWSREATYFDSADLTLAAQGVTVTRDAGGTWTLMVPGQRAVEVSGAAAGAVTDGPDGAQRVPPAIRDRLHTRLRSRRLRAVARLVTTRTTVELFAGAGRVARVIHDEVMAHAADGTRRYGRLVLVPTTTGPLSRTVLGALVAACTARGCISTPYGSDLQLACGVLSPSGPVPRAAMPKRARSAPLADLVAPMLSGSVERLFAHDLGVRLDTDPEDVHQLRVATRRVRADLRALRPVLDRPRADSLRAEASWLASLAGDVRDADVLGDRLRAALQTLPEVSDDEGSRLLLRLAGQRQRQHEMLLNGMRSARYDALLDALVDAVAHPPVRKPRRARGGRRASAVLARATAQQWQGFVAAVREAGEDPTPADLHRVRIAAKHARYTAEAATPALGKPAARLAVLATRVQTLLGDLHDAVVAQAWLQDAGADPALTHVTGRLCDLERARADELQHRWPPLWDRTRRKAARALKALPAR